MALCGGYLISYFALSPFLKRVWLSRFQATTARFKLVNEIFGALKEVTVLGRKGSFLSQYDMPAKLYARSMGNAQLALVIPQYTLQILAVTLVLLFAIMVVVVGEGRLEDSAPVLALFLFGAQRMIPFFLTVYQNYGEIRVNSVVAETIYADMLEFVTTESVNREVARLSFKEELRLNDVSFGYPNSDRLSIDKASISIPQRSFVAFVGRTGSGKTTVVDIIMGLLKPTKGNMTVDGEVISGDLVQDWQNNLGYVPQEIYLIDDTVGANIALGIPREHRSQAAIEKAAKIANIHDFIVNNLSFGYETVVGENGVRLSGGERQRIGIARALYHDPDVLVLDEATSNLDQGTEAAVHLAIEGATMTKTVIMIAHRLSVSKRCDVLYFFDDGRVIDYGSYEGLLDKNEQFKAMASVT